MAQDTKLVGHQLRLGELRRDLRVAARCLQRAHDKGDLRAVAHYTAVLAEAKRKVEEEKVEWGQ